MESAFNQCASQIGRRVRVVDGDNRHQRASLKHFVEPTLQPVRKGSFHVDDLIIKTVVIQDFIARLSFSLYQPGVVPSGAPVNGKAGADKQPDRHIQYCADILQGRCQGVFLFFTADV